MNGMDKLQNLQKKQNAINSLRATGRDVTMDDLEGIPDDALNELTEIVTGLDDEVVKVREIFHTLLDDGYVDIVLIAVGIIMREVLDEVHDDDEEMYESMVEILTMIIGDE